MATGLDHKEIVDWEKRGIRVIPKGSKDGGKDDTSTQNNRIDRNYLHKFKGNKKNGTEGIQLGKGMKNTFVKLMKVVEYNLLDQVMNDDEMLSIKSSDNIIQFNNFINLKVTMQVRHGTNNQFISNVVEDAMGMVIYGDKNKVIGNVLDNTPIIVSKGNTTQDNAMKKLSSGKYGHPAAHNTLLAANKVIDSFIGVGVRIPGGGSYSGKPAENTKLEGNLPKDIQDKIEKGDQNHTTEKDSYDGEVSPAVELTKSDVGPDAPEAS